MGNEKKANKIKVGMIFGSRMLMDKNGIGTCAWVYSVSTQHLHKEYL